jgi:hypothetical protein
MHREPAAPIPQNCRFTLVGNPEGRKVARRQSGASESFGDDFLRIPPDFDRIMLYPARARIELSVLLLRLRDDLSAAVEDHEPRARGPLIERGDVAL